MQPTAQKQIAGRENDILFSVRFIRILKALSLFIKKEEVE